MHYRQRMYVRELDFGLSARAVALRLAARPGLAWLDAEGADPSLRDARFSYVTCDPVAAWESRADDRAPYAIVDACSREAAEPDDPASPLAAAAVPRAIGYLAYDACFAGDARRARATEPATKLACFARYEACFVFDHVQRAAFVAGDDPAACERLIARLAPREQACVAHASAPRWPDAARHAQAIERALEHIARGDVYQVNLARALSAKLDGDPLALALAMRDASPVPFGFYFDDAERAIIGRSMERFLRFDARDRTLVTRPIKGTLARTGDDGGEARTLTSDPKERAEHAMIVDLMRNDLSRVAKLGTVHVPEVMAVERYAQLSHLVSTVACSVRDDASLRDLVEATFPPGSVTGAPKLRAIEVIDALEAAPRGVYTGAYGFVDRAGGLSLAVAIRTATVQAGEARYWSGGGIVEASRVASELAETELKARVFCDALRALGASEAGALGVLGLSGPPVVR